MDENMLGLRAGKRNLLNIFLKLSLIVILYTVYSITVNNLMCFLGSSTCCVKGRVHQQPIQTSPNLGNSAIQDIHFSVNADACKDKTESGGVWLVIGVMSYVQFVESRDAIRKTWGSILERYEPAPVCLIFIVGKRNQDDAFDTQFRKEVRKHRDIIQINKDDNYRNLVYKSIGLLKWIEEHVRHFDFLLKVDEDVFLNLPNLFHKLFLFSSQPRFIMGQIITNSPTKRENYSRHYISHSQYPGDKLPNYVNGPSYVISGDLIPDILKMIPRTPIVYVEDIYITGIIISYLKGVTHIGQCGFVRKKDDRYGLSPTSVTVHDLLGWETVLTHDALLHSTQNIALSLSYS